MCSPTTSWRSTPAGISRCSRSKLASWAKRGLTSASPALTSSSSASYSPRGPKVGPIPTMRQHPVAEPGDLWVLGRHRLLCGDSELVGAAPAPPAGRCDGAGGVFATVGLQLERVRAAQAPGTRVEVWFQDKARIGQNNSLTRVWGQTGSRPSAPKDLGFASAYLFGAVCRSEGKAAALIMPICNPADMNQHLSEISSQVAPDAHAVVILDGAGWHRSQGLGVAGNIPLLELPPYSPELNPVERVWHYLPSHWLANSVFPSLGDIMDACETAWNRFAAADALIRSLCAIAWAPALPAL